jgi:hypothetical protein
MKLIITTRYSKAYGTQSYHCVVISRGSTACVRKAPWRWRYLMAISHCTSVPTVWTLGCLKLRTVLWISALCVGKTKWEKYDHLGYGTVQSCRWAPTVLWNILLLLLGFLKLTLKVYMACFFEVFVTVYLSTRCRNLEYHSRNLHWFKISDLAKYSVHAKAKNSLYCRYSLIMYVCK